MRESLQLVIDSQWQQNMQWIATNSKITINEKPSIEVAVGVISNNLTQVLIAKRPHHWMGGGFWEFPGGKLEPGESAQHALKREVLEEVGLKVQEGTALIKLEYEYPERFVILNAWWVNDYLGDAEGLEGQEVRWVLPFELNTINMLPANRSIVLATQVRWVLLLLMLAKPHLESTAKQIWWLLENLYRDVENFI